MEDFYQRMTAVSHNMQALEFQLSKCLSLPSRFGSVEQQLSQELERTVEDLRSYAAATSVSPMQLS